MLSQKRPKLGGVFKMGTKMSAYKMEQSTELAIRSNYIFSELNESEIKIIKKMIYLRNYKTGEVVFEQNQSGIGMYIVVSGKVSLESDKTYIEAKTGQEKTKIIAKKILKEGTVFGESSLIEDENLRTATAKVMEPTALIAFFKPDLLDLLKNRPEMASKIYSKLKKDLPKLAR
jgi:CRP/FNR family transcriptional regulator, cyclic AMP receptor protein